MKIYILTLMLLFTSLFGGDNYFYQNGKKVYLSPNLQVQSYSRSSTEKLSKLKYFTTNNNNTIGISDEILITTNTNINKLLTTYDITLVKQLSAKIYLVKVNNPDNILDISNRLYEDENVQYSHPNFTREINFR